MEVPRLTPAIFTGENKKTIAELIEEDRRKKRNASSRQTED
jgi:hypothetical protein